MKNNENDSLKRFEELKARAESRDIRVCSDFLDMNLQSLLLSHIKNGFTLYGGYEGAERNIAVFGSEQNIGYAACPPVVCVKISPLSQKFSEELTHRDYLGSLMALGLKRETLGDIVTDGADAYVFCLDTAARFIVDNLIQVRKTSVSCEITESLPQLKSETPTQKEINIASERLDVIIGAVYNLSRSASALLFKAQKVYVNARLVESTSFIPKEGDKISVRGYGRFVFNGILRETRKGRLYASVDVFGEKR